LRYIGSTKVTRRETIAHEYATTAIPSSFDVAITGWSFGI
jgi:hypothetical protein